MACLPEAVELRLDLWPLLDMGEIAELLNKLKVPVMLTLRSLSFGGKFAGSQEEREAKILQMADLKPDFLDLECDLRPAFIEKILQDYPDVKTLISYHNFQKTPDNLEEIFFSLKRHQAFGYKIACLAQSTIDALKMLLLGKENPNFSVICMGERGEFARVIGKIAGNLFDFACVDEQAKTAPGQLSYSELVDIYRYPKLNLKTAIYGLIGDPVSKSIGHLHHNGVFAKRGIDAVYVKMCVESNELSTFFPLARELGFSGLSVTMPLKEAILPFVDTLEKDAQMCGSANTLLFKENVLIGTNTDGKGALDAIEKKMFVHGKKVTILGAGGAARAIAFEAQKRGADVLILNRTVDKAKELAHLLKCRFGPLTHIAQDQDIVINCSPEIGTIDLSVLNPSVLAMDIVYSPKETPFLEKAIQMGCQIVYGEEMFFNQAERQTNFWFPCKESLLPPISQNL